MQWLIRQASFNIEAGLLDDIKTNYRKFKDSDWSDRISRLKKGGYDAMAIISLLVSIGMPQVDASDIVKKTDQQPTSTQAQPIQKDNSILPFSFKDSSKKENIAIIIKLMGNKEKALFKSKDGSVIGVGSSINHMGPNSLSDGQRQWAEHLATNQKDMTLLKYATYQDPTTNVWYALAYSGKETITSD